MFGRFATRRHEAQYPRFFEGLAGAWCPSVTGPTGLNLYNLQGRNINGTLTNMDAPTDWVRSQGLYALDFDGTNDFISLGSRAGDLTETIPFTVSAWALARTTGSNRGLLSRDASSPYALSIRFNFGSTLNVLCDGVEITGPTITTDVWFHSVFTFATSLRRIYLNGVQSVESTASYTITANNDELRIGTDFNAASDRVWDGLIGEITIWNRALTAGEIQQLYRLGRGGMFRARRDVVFGSTANRRRRLLTGMV